jgi:hypothetical protein
MLYVIVSDEIMADFSFPTVDTIPFREVQTLASLPPEAVGLENIALHLGDTGGSGKEAHIVAVLDTSELEDVSH